MLPLRPASSRVPWSPTRSGSGPVMGSCHAQVAATDLCAAHVRTPDLCRPQVVLIGEFNRCRAQIVFSGLGDLCHAQVSPLVPCVAQVAFSDLAHLCSAHVGASIRPEPGPQGSRASETVLSLKTVSRCVFYADLNLGLTGCNKWRRSRRFRPQSGFLQPAKGAPLHDPVFRAPQPGEAPVP